MRRAWVAAAGFCFAACAHPSPGPAPARQAQPTGVIVSAELVSRGSKESIAAWLTYAAIRKATFDAWVPNPRRHRSADDYTIELNGRRAMIVHWRDSRAQGGPADAYLDGQVAIENAHFLEEYVLAFTSDPGWTVTGDDFSDLDWPRYRVWAAEHLAGHQLQQHSNYVPPSGERRPRSPGAGLPDPSTLLPTKRPCAETRPALDAAVATWAEEEKTLDAVPLVAASRAEFVRVLEWAAGQPVVRERGVIWALPAVAELHFLAGFCANDRQDWNAATRHLEKLVQLSPLEPKFRGELVHALSQQKRYDDAERAIASALALEPDRCTEARLLRNRGFIQVERKLPADAYQTYARSLELDPDSEVARREIAFIVQLLKAAGGADTKALSAITPESKTTTTVSRCRE